MFFFIHFAVYIYQTIKLPHSTCNVISRNIVPHASAVGGLHGKEIDIIQSKEKPLLEIIVTDITN